MKTMHFPFSDTTSGDSEDSVSALSIRMNSLTDDPCGNELYYSESLRADLEDVLSTKYKTVHFQPDVPNAVSYTVSLSVDEYALRRPGKLFPLSLAQSTTATTEDLVLCPETLKMAVLNAMLHAEDSTHDLEEEQCPGTPTKTEPKALSVAGTKTRKFIELFIQQKWSLGDVYFDKIAVTPSNQKTVLLSSRGLSKGYHEWSVEIWRCDVDLQEIGVIATSDIDGVPVSDFGAMATADFKSRAIYGSDMASDRLFYGSWNSDGSARCSRDLRPHFKCGWTAGSLITVKLDLEKWRIKFFINNTAVRYTMSLEPHKVYHPVICTQGNCKYVLL